MTKKIKIAVGAIKGFILSNILSKDITIFVQEKSPAIFEIEVTDSKARVRLTNIKIQKITDIRYRVIDRQSL